MAETSDRNPQALFEQEPDDPLPEPEPEVAPAETDAREATELTRIQRNYSRASASYQRQGSSTSSRKPTTLLERFTYGVSKFWRHQVSVTVPHVTCRDHLALERTFLGYLRTSLAMSMLGITVAQLFRLQHSPTPNADFGFYVLGKPLACICQGTAIYTLVIGAFRSWRSQNAMVRGKAITGGIEITLLAGGLFIILLLFFVLLIAVDVSKEDVASK